MVCPDKKLSSYPSIKGRVNRLSKYNDLNTLSRKELLFVEEKSFRRFLIEENE